MVSLDDAIEDVKQQYGFSDQAWELYGESQAEQMRREVEVERLRAVLRKIARTATQSGDTAFGGRLCHQIEQMARAALAE